MVGLTLLRTGAASALATSTPAVLEVLSTLLSDEYVEDEGAMEDCEASAVRMR